MYPAAPVQIQTHITAFIDVNSGTEIANKKYTLQQAEGLSSHTGIVISVQNLCIPVL